MPEDTQKEETLGQRLTWARDTAGLSYSQAAKLLHMERFELIQLETNQCGASNALIDEMAVLYDVSTEWLTTGLEREVSIPEKQWMSKDDAESLRRLFARMRQNS